MPQDLQTSQASYFVLGREPWNRRASYSEFGTDQNGNVTGNQQCINAAGGAASAGAAQLLNYGCFVSGSTVITPPVYGTQGDMARNIFRGDSFMNWDENAERETIYFSPHCLKPMALFGAAFEEEDSALM